TFPSRPFSSPTAARPRGDLVHGHVHVLPQPETTQLIVQNAPFTSSSSVSVSARIARVPTVIFEEPFFCISPFLLSIVRLLVWSGTRTWRPCGLLWGHVATFVPAQ